jgi:hypothetical protein
MTRAAVLNVILLGAALVWLAMLTLPVRHLVRARNAFMLRRGVASDFEWSPVGVPADFRVERGPIPDAIVEAVKVEAAGEPATDWERALMLEAMLVRHARNGGGIRADLATTYRQIVRGSGYCADYVRVYIAAATAAGLFCRQWAFSLDGFGGHGHTFVEIFDRQRSRWVFLDVHNNVYAVKRGAADPLTALGLRDALRSAPAEIEFRRAAEGRLGYPDAAKLLDYYRRGAPQWYLLWGNDVAARERRGVARVLLAISGRLAYRLGSGLLGMPPLVALVTGESEAAFDSMRRLRRRIVTAVFIVAALSGALALQVGVQRIGASHG